MTAIREPTRTEAPEAVAEGDEGGLGDASLGESLAVLGTGVIPALVRGLFSPRPRAMKLLTARDADGRAIELLAKLRRKYEGQGLKLLGGRLVVLWGEQAIKQVLDTSADAYAGNAGAKAKGMAHFQPDALTMSYGEEWRERRAFNEAVLAAHDRVHPNAQQFLAVVADEVGRLGLAETLAWSQWETLFDHLTLRVIFGDQARDDQDLTALLERLMGEANRLVGLQPNDDYYEFYGRLEHYLREPNPESLVAQIAQAPHNDSTRIVQQIPHWMFAMRDTLAANTFRALAAIVADSSVKERVVSEIEASDPSDPGAVDGLTYLEGCFLEAMRLWPTTPLLARESARDTKLAGEELEEGTQVVMLNVFNHRDPDHVADSDRLAPERWNKQDHDYRFNHLSNGSQDCPGGPLVLLLGKTVLAGILKRYSLSLVQPSLGDGEPLPPMLDFFQTRFSVRPR